MGFLLFMPEQMKVNMCDGRSKMEALKLVYSCEWPREGNLECAAAQMILPIEGATLFQERDPSGRCDA